MNSRRKTLKYVLGVTAGVGAVLASIPFVKSLSIAGHKTKPTKDIDISGLEEGQMLKVELFNRHLIIAKRSKEDLERLNKPNEKLLDPLSIDSNQPETAANSFRSVRPDVFVAVGMCTHLGCGVSHRPDVAPEDLGPEWGGGFYCPCHGARYDNAGRVFKNVPAPRNLDVPNYEFIDENTIRVQQYGKSF